jgi:hypothetical protein
MQLVKAWKNVKFFAGIPVATGDMPVARQFSERAQS